MLQIVITPLTIGSESYYKCALLLLPPGGRPHLDSLRLRLLLGFHHSLSSSRLSFLLLSVLVTSLAVFLIFVCTQEKLCKNTWGILTIINIIATAWINDKGMIKVPQRDRRISGELYISCFLLVDRSTDTSIILLCEVTYTCNCSTIDFNLFLILLQTLMSTRSYGLRY